jgi:hypothetical protein
MTDRIDMGKWSEPGVPHKGWVCLGVDDLGPGELMTCQMCMVAQIRYVHAMVHDDYPEKLLCGCVCAGGSSRRGAASEGDGRHPG